MNVSFFVHVCIAMMKAMILAAGVGSRLRPLTDTIPKPMLPIDGEPLLAHTLRWLHSYGVYEVALNLYHLPHVVQQGLGDGSRWGMRLHYAVEHELLGTAGAVKQFEALWDEPFLVVYGDLLLDLDLDALRKQHDATHAAMTIALKQTDTPQSQGMIERDAAGRIMRFVEKPSEWHADQRTANAGVYIVDPRLLARIPTGRASDWGHDIIPAMLADGERVYGAIVDGTVIDIGTPAVYEQVVQHGWKPRSVQRNA